MPQTTLNTTFLRYTHEKNGHLDKKYIKYFEQNLLCTGTTKAYLITIKHFHNNLDPGFKKWTHNKLKYLHQQFEKGKFKTFQHLI